MYIVHFYTSIIITTIIIITITSNNQRLRSARDKILCIKISHVDGQKYEKWKIQMHMSRLWIINKNTLKIGV